MSSVPVTFDTGSLAMPAAAAATGEPEPDWSVPEQVASHVSKSTMASMQQLWRAHAAAMDIKGREFAETMYTTHAEALKVCGLHNNKLHAWTSASRSFLWFLCYKRLFDHTAPSSITSNIQRGRVNEAPSPIISYVWFTNCRSRIGRDLCMLPAVLDDHSSAWLIVNAAAVLLGTGPLVMHLWHLPSATCLAIPFMAPMLISALDVN